MEQIHIRTSPFPLLNAPFLVREEVIRNLSELERIDFSSLSKRSRYLIKECSRKNSYKITLNVQGSISLTISTLKNGTVEISSKEINQKFRVLDPSSQYLPRVDQAIRFADHLCHIFKTSIHKVQISSCHNTEQLAKISSWISTRQKSLEHFDVELRNKENVRESVPKNYLTFLLNNFESKTMFLKSSRSDSYYFEYKNPFKQEKLWIEKSDGFNLRNLMTATCAKIDLNWTQITCQELNVFLKSWVNGLFPNLHHLVLSTFNCDIRALWNGLEIEMMSDDENFVRHTYESVSGSIETIFTNKLIRRNDGLAARIKWPDTRGNDFKLISYDLCLS